MISFKEYFLLREAKVVTPNRGKDPINFGDTIRVYHGFRDTRDALDAAKVGMSGKERANRVYSYESNQFDNEYRKLMLEFVGVLEGRDLRLDPEDIYQIRAIPESKLGYSTSLESLPKTKPYGFWISRHGNFLVVNEAMGHAEEAYKIGKILWDNYKIHPRFYTGDFSEAMNFMEQIGTIRIVMGGPDGIHVDANEITNGQRKTIEYIKDLYL